MRLTLLYPKFPSHCLLMREGDRHPLTCAQTSYFLLPMNLGILLLSLFYKEVKGSLWKFQQLLLKDPVYCCLIED